MDYLQRIIPKLGEQLGRYQLMAELGRGGYGVVYRARQSGLEVDVAIKVMIPPVTTHENQMQHYERFVQEAQVIKRLEHPAAIKVRDFGRTDQGLPYLVTEYVPGRTLDTLIVDEGPLSTQRVIRIAKQVLGCLAEAHHHGIVHRDLKPGNIMVRDIYGETDSVKVLDFGLAKVAGDTSDIRTGTGQIFGTPQYMAPEQAMALKDLDGRLDLYAVGLILAECLSGQRVVDATEALSALFRHAGPQPHEFHALVKASPLHAFIVKSCHKDREQRYANALAMRDALVEIEQRQSFPSLPALEMGAAGGFSARPPLQTPPPFDREAPTEASLPTPVSSPVTAQARPVRPPPVETPATPPAPAQAPRARATNRLLPIGIAVLLVAVGGAGLLMSLSGDGNGARGSATDGGASVGSEAGANGLGNAADADGADATVAVPTVVILIPNHDTYNGAADRGRPDSAGVRAAVLTAIGEIETGAHVTIEIGLYASSVTWLPTVSPLEIQRLQSELYQPGAVSPPGTSAVDPWSALEEALGRLPSPASGTSEVTAAVIVVYDPSVTDVATVFERADAGFAPHAVTSWLAYRPEMPPIPGELGHLDLAASGDWLGSMGSAATLSDMLEYLVAESITDFHANRNYMISRHQRLYRGELEDDNGEPPAPAFESLIHQASREGIAGRSTESVALIQQAHSLDTTRWLPYLLLYVGYWRLGDQRTAVGYLSQYLARWPDDPDSYHYQMVVNQVLGMEAY